MPLSEPRGGSGAATLVNNVPITSLGFLPFDSVVDDTSDLSDLISVNNTMYGRVDGGTADGEVFRLQDRFAIAEMFVNSPGTLSGGASSALSLNYDFTRQALLLTQGNDAFLSSNLDPATATWADITPPAATGRNTMFSLSSQPGDLFILTSTLAGPARNVEISNDGGLTWDSNPGAFINVGTGQSPRGGIVAPDGSILCTWGGAAGGGRVAFVTDPENGADATVDIGVTLSNVGSWNSDGSIFVNAAGGLIYIFQEPFATFTTIGRDANPFGISVAPYPIYIESLSGWMLVGRDQNEDNVAGFLFENDLTQVVQGISIIQNSVVTNKYAGATDGNGAIVVGNNLECIRTL